MVAGCIIFSAMMKRLRYLLVESFSGRWLFKHDHNLKGGRLNSSHPFFTAGLLIRVDFLVLAILSPKSDRFISWTTIHCLLLQIIIIIICVV
jgi:hypothetical protein